MPSPNETKFRALLAELFMLDQADLDFGLYRIMNARRDEITRFLDQDLLPQVRATLAAVESGDRAQLEAELAKAIEAAGALGVDPEITKAVQSLRERLAAGPDLAALESQVFSHLTLFFRRYYDRGDFISQRRYREGVYAIPYEGEEVKLYWANHDQYYIKTTESFRDYAFCLPDNLAADLSHLAGQRVHFKLVEADTERDNNQANGDSGRQFVLCDEEPMVEEDGELVIRFAYRPTLKGTKQEDLNDRAVEVVLGTLASGGGQPSLFDTPGEPDGFRHWRRALACVPDPDKYPGRTLLAARLKHYTAKNTFDYFIHKDLGTFLRRELDFYLKNEVMHLDDVDKADAATVESYLALLKANRCIGHKIIDFLAQLEDFQRRLWLKRKFVVETQWCVTLDRVPPELYPEIAANEAQREAWVRLFAIDEIPPPPAQPADAVPLTVGFLEAQPHLVLDTRHFDEGFKQRLLASFDDLDEATDGVLFHSENFQALQILQERYRGGVQCIYIDPPYNTDASPIAYKNGYKASSWVALMDDRLRLARPMLRAEGVLVAAIDDEQQRELSFALPGAFDGRLLGTICVRANPSGRPTQTGYSVSHEYLLFAGQSEKSSIGRLPPTAEQMARFTERDDEGVFEWRNLRREGSDSNREDRAAMYYPLYIRGATIRVPAMDWDDQRQEWVTREEPEPGEAVVWPDNEAGVQKRWRWGWDTVVDRMADLSVRTDRSGRDYVYCKRRPHEQGVVSVSSWFDAKYSATEHGTAVLKGLFGRTPFSYPKSIHAVVDAVYVAGASRPRAAVLDFFAGSGTTAHAVINLNRADGGRRRYILVEMGAYFDTVLLPRIQKVIYSADWKDGKPVSRKGSSHLLKYVRLESYEDTLNNLELRHEQEQLDLLAGSPESREDYLLHYWLDLGTSGSPCLLDAQQFTNPFTYQLKIATDSAGATKPENVDLVETFNWLLGLRVQNLGRRIHRTADFEHTEHGRLVVRGGRAEPCDPALVEQGGGWSFSTVEGVAPDGDRVLVVWRTLTGDSEKDNAVLEAALFSHGRYNVLDLPFDVVYVNGDSNLENLRRDDQTWKVRLIEPTFRRLMFQEQNV